MTTKQFIDGLERGGYWDEFCRPCDRVTPHPNGKCRVCKNDPEREHEE